MCDKQHFEELEGRVNCLEKNYIEHNATSAEQIKTLFASVRMLFWITIVFGGILLLTVVYGAVGAKGFNHVTTAAGELVPAVKE